MTTEEEPAAAPRLVEELAAIDRWREEEEQRLVNQVGEVDLEQERLRDSISELERQVSALDRFRDELRGELAGLEPRKVERCYHALVDSLEADSSLLAARAHAWAQAGEQRRRELEQLLEAPELAETVHEYERFCEVAGSLSGLPPSYRKAILDHHEAVRRRLRPLFLQAEGLDAVLDLPLVGLALVASLGGRAESPEVLATVLPVDASIHERWKDGPWDLRSILAHRVHAAICRTAIGLGMPGARITCHPYLGFLSIQLWPDGALDPVRVRDQLSAALDRLREESTELRGARVELFTLWLDAEILSPEEE